VTDEDQPRLFDPDRFSPATVAVLLRLPESSARAFQVASALGRFLDGEGTARSTRSAKETSGTLIPSSGVHGRQVILSALDITVRSWNRFVTDFAERYIAHRCGRGTVFLFTTPMQNPCPACKQDIPFDHEHKRARPPRGTGFARPNGTTSVPQKDRMRPETGTGTSQPLAQLRPVLSAKSEHLVGGLTRANRGVYRRSSFEVEVEGQGPGLTEIAASCVRCERYGIDHAGTHIERWRT
jgi:hypothetical protein